MTSGFSTRRRAVGHNARAVANRNHQLRRRVGPDDRVAPPPTSGTWFRTAPMTRGAGPRLTADPADRVLHGGELAPLADGSRRPGQAQVGVAQRLCYCVTV